ncbi:MAG: hypothetical protein M3Q97_11855, partial [Bacteroidota bacterium]|nr:hypothetical protein [Bacteroidota bacterium]
MAYIDQKSCPACTSKNVKQRYTIPDHEYNLAINGKYAECDNCASLYQDPMPDDNELHKLYPEHYHSFTRNNLIAKMKHKSRLGRLEKFLDKDDAVILDYGCGNGSFI